MFLFVLEEYYLGVFVADMYDILNTVAIIASIISASAGLGYWLATKFKEIEERFTGIDGRFEEIENRTDGRFKEIESRIDWRFKEFENRIDGRFAGIENRLDRLEKMFYSYNELLLKILESKNILTPVEAMTLVHTLKALLPTGMSKYYTKEVEEKLRKLLDKDLNEYTLQDTRELENIADLMFEEYVVSKRKELLDYGERLRVFAQVVRIMFVIPKITKGEQALKPGEKK